MLPNWLYGKSKSKLANILGGGGGTPADYNQVKAQVNQNTENIELLGDALDTKAALTQISNPNLLDNPWFTVNQRGFTTASSASNTYVADRWKVVSASGITITNGEAGITIDNTNGSTNVTMETLLAPNVSKSLLGREVTMSLSTAIGVTHLYKTFTMPDSLPQSSTLISHVTAEDCTLRTVITSSGYVKVDVQVKEGKSITIRAIKLEIGSISTLARDSRPVMATELAKCQRYFQRIAPGTSNIWLAMGNGYNGNANFVIPIAPMRANPTLTYANITLASVQTTSVAIASKTGERYDALRSRCHLTLTYDPESFAETELPLGIYAGVNSGAYLDFDAEL